MSLSIVLLCSVFSTLIITLFRKFIVHKLAAQHKNWCDTGLLLSNFGCHHYFIIYTEILVFVNDLQILFVPFKKKICLIINDDDDDDEGNSCLAQYEKT